MDVLLVCCGAQLLPQLPLVTCLLWYTFVPHIQLLPIPRSDCLVFITVTIVRVVVGNITARLFCGNIDIDPQLTLACSHHGDITKCNTVK